MKIDLPARRTAGHGLATAVLSASAFLTAILIPSGVPAQSFSHAPATPDAPSSRTVKPAPAPVAKTSPAGVREVAECATLLTQTTDRTTVTALNSISCNNNTASTQNSYLRVFDLPALGVVDGYVVTNVRFGVEQAAGPGGSQPAAINLYTVSGALQYANMTLLHSEPITISDQSSTFMHVDIADTFVPAGAKLVLELASPDGQTDGWLFFIGSNASGESAPSYIAASSCGVNEPTAFSSIGFPNVHVLLEASGYCAPDDGDGVPTALEVGAPNGGDGNLDGIADALQADVASIPNGATTGPYAGQYLTVVAPGGLQLSEVATQDAPNPLPAGVSSFPVGLVGFRVTGEMSEYPNPIPFRIIMEQAPDPVVSSYFKLSGRSYIPFTAPIPVPAAFPIGFTGGAFDGDRSILLNLVDDNGAGVFGETGDADPATSSILDPGGPAVAGPLLVSLGDLAATAVPGGVRIDWTTLAEVDNAGFNIYRNAGATFTQVNGAFISAAGIDGSGATYSFTDTANTDGSYFLEDIDLNGTRTLHGPVSASAVSDVKDWSLF